MFHISFYRFADVADPAALRAQLLALTDALLGTVLVAHEGVNGMLAGPPDELDAFEAAVQSPELLGGAFAGMAFKRTVCDVAPFRRRKIKVKPEMVPLDVAGIDVPSRRADIEASNAGTLEWRELLRRKDVVVIDNRNSFEFGHGHFVGAIDPGTTDFRDFAAYVRANAEQWRATGKTIAMTAPAGSVVRSRVRGCRTSASPSVNSVAASSRTWRRQQMPSRTGRGTASSSTTGVCSTSACSRSRARP